MDSNAAAEMSRGEVGIGRRKKNKGREEEQETTKKKGSDSHHRRLDGPSTTGVFVAVDYVFLFIFFCFLCFFLFQIWRGSSGGGASM